MGTLGMKTIAALIGAAITASAVAQAPRDERVTKVTAPWKIGGVGIGMTPAEVAVAVKEDGYKLSRRSYGRSWQEQVTRQVSSLRTGRRAAGPEVITSEIYHVGQEQMQVTYTAGKGGAYVSRVDYAIDLDAIETENMRRAVIAKYGRPSLQWELESIYCSTGEQECTRTGSLRTNQLPNLTVYLVSVTKRVLQLRQGERADKAYWAAVRAEAERLYPKMGKPTF
jgi:hypothetical protein